MTNEDSRARTRSYVEEVARQGPEHVAALAEAEWRRLEELTAGLTEEEAHSHPIEGEWSVAEVVQHLTLSHEGNVERIELLSKGEAFAGPMPVPGALPADPPATFAGQRQLLLDLVRRASEVIRGAGPGAQAELTAPHPAFGEYTWLQWAGHMHVHARAHIAQIEKVRQAVEEARAHA